MVHSRTNINIYVKNSWLRPLLFKRFFSSKTYSYSLCLSNFNNIYITCVQHYTQNITPSSHSGLLSHICQLFA